jgi:segregation and condensation protein B
LESKQLKQIIEGALLASGQALDVKRLLELFVDDLDPATGQKVTAEDIDAAIESIVRDCEGRGFQLKQVSSGWRFQVREETAPWVNRLWEEKPQKYSRAMLETLALIAYRQPITRGDIEEIRGVAVSSHIIKTLAERDWVKVVGHRDVPGRPSLYATTKIFLDYFNLKSLEELPSLGELADIEQLNPELNLEVKGVEVAKPESSTEEAADSGDSSPEQQELTEHTDDDPEADGEEGLQYDAEQLDLESETPEPETFEPETLEPVEQDIFDTDPEVLEDDSGVVTSEETTDEPLNHSGEPQEDFAMAVGSEHDADIADTDIAENNIADNSIAENDIAESNQSDDVAVAPDLEYQTDLDADLNEFVDDEENSVVESDANEQFDSSIDDENIDDDDVSVNEIEEESERHDQADLEESEQTQALGASNHEDSDENALEDIADNTDEDQLSGDGALSEPENEESEEDEQPEVHKAKSLFDIS